MAQQTALTRRLLRTACPRCGRSRSSYCNDCVLVLEEPPPQPIRLPCKFDIVQHWETNARSTALHAALLAPGDVTLHRHAGTATSRRCDLLNLQLPDFDPATTVVLFPGGPHTEVVGQPGCAPFRRVVLLESSWKKAHGLLRHPKLAGLRCVQLPAGHLSDFCWRRGDGGFRGAVDGGVSSIEAIYHCCRLLASSGNDYAGLLRYFIQTRELVQRRGTLPTNRQEARARDQQRKLAAAAAGGGGAEACSSQARARAVGDRGACPCPAQGGRDCQGG